jgi:hypothetical protein
MVLDVVSIGPEPRTIQPGETLRFDVVSGCPMGEQDTDGDYETFMEHVKATGLRILPVPIKTGNHCLSICAHRYTPGFFSLHSYAIPCGVCCIGNCRFE